MKKFLIAGFLTMTAAVAFADYNYLEFKYADGSVRSLQTDGLVIRIDGSELQVTNSESESLQVNASLLASMQFVNEATGKVSNLTSSAAPVEIYNLNGVRIGNYDSADQALQTLPQGVYVIKKANGETVKLIVNK